MISPTVLKKKIIGLFDFFEKEINKDTLDVWIETLQRESLDNVDKAFKHYMKTAQFAPKPAQITALIKELKDSRARERQAQPVPEYNPPSNDHLMDLMEKTMDAESFKHYCALVFHILGKAPGAIIAKVQWKLMWYAAQIKNGNASLEAIKANLN